MSACCLRRRKGRQAGDQPRAFALATAPTNCDAARCSDSTKSKARCVGIDVSKAILDVALVGRRRQLQVCVRMYDGRQSAGWESRMTCTEIREHMRWLECTPWCARSTPSSAHKARRTGGTYKRHCCPVDDITAIRVQQPGGLQRAPHPDPDPQLPDPVTAPLVFTPRTAQETSCLPWACSNLLA